MSGSTKHAVTVTDAFAGQRIDLVVKDGLKLSRAVVKSLFDEGKVRIKGRIMKKGVMVEAGQVIDVELPSMEKAAVADSSITLDVLHEDAALVFVNKPAHMPSHPLRPGEVGTVANALISRYPEVAAASEDSREGGLCHRLDVETSGVLLAARSREAWQKMREAFSRHGDVDKRYWAAVSGPLADSGEIDLPLRHHPRHDDRVEPAAEGGDGAREARSEFRVLVRSGELSLVEVRIFTGVLHQVRAHMAAIGAPLLGDALYGGRAIDGLDRFFLHAQSLAVKHPDSGETATVQAPLPSELAEVAARLGLVVK